ncbi:UNVERIFIED_CONTAM: hypothetical protein FKN15_028299 [Acipenser sinensis]
MFPASTAEPYTPLGAPGLAAGSSPCSGPGSANITSPGADPACTGVTPDVTEPDVSIEEVHDAICGLMGRWLLPSEAALPPLRSARVSSAHCTPATPVDWLGACGLACTETLTFPPGCPSPENGELGSEPPVQGGSSTVRMATAPSVGSAHLGTTHCPLWFSLRSCGNPLGVDALARAWPKALLYAFLPILLLPAFLQKVRRDKATVLLVASKWPRRFLFSNLCQLLQGQPWEILLRMDLLSQVQGTLWHPKPGRLQLWVWPLNGTNCPP